MPHWLLPPDGHEYLSVDDVLDRLRDEFRFVEADAAAGVERVGDWIAQYGRLGRHEIPDLERAVERLEQVRGEAVQIALFDDPSSRHAYLSFTLIPGEPLLIDYSSPEHEEAVRPFVERCASALDYV